MKNASEKIRLAGHRPAGHFLRRLALVRRFGFWIFQRHVGGELAAPCMPSFMAWYSVPTPRKTGYLKILYFSDMRASGISSVTISPFGLRTATQ